MTQREDENRDLQQIIRKQGDHDNRRFVLELASKSYVSGETPPILDIIQRAEAYYNFLKGNENAG